MSKEAPDSLPLPKVVKSELISIPDLCEAVASSDDRLSTEEAIDVVFDQFNALGAWRVPLFVTTWNTAVEVGSEDAPFTVSRTGGDYEYWDVLSDVFNTNWWRGAEKRETLILGQHATVDDVAILRADAEQHFAVVLTEVSKGGPVARVENAVDQLEGYEDRTGSCDVEAYVGFQMKELEKSNDWYECIKEAALSFFNETGRYADKGELWARLHTNPPRTYGVGVTEDPKGEKALSLPGKKRALTRDAFDKRFEEYFKHLR